MSDWIDRLAADLETDAAPLALAFSGGLDSSVLLDLLAGLPAARRRGLRALHVDHGLHPESPRWAGHCIAFCAARGIDCAVLPVQVSARGSIEAAAREARYAALCAALADGEWLVLAQHRDDQAETVLLRLLRGSASAGLAAMRPRSTRAGCTLWRPLLEVPRATLQQHAERQALDWLDDPANADPRFTRNRLRHELLPVLRRIWPQADAALATSARLLAEDAELLDTLAARALADCASLDRHCLRLDRLTRFEPPLQRRVLRHWLAGLGAPMPPATVLARLHDELIELRPDAEPTLAWQGWQLRRYRQLLHAAPAPPDVAADWQLDWDGRMPLTLPAPFGTLAVLPEGAALPPMQVRPRRGGERIAQAGRPRQSLQHLLQQLAIPPWERARLPLLFAADDGELLAAGDLAIAPRLQALLDAAGGGLRWQVHDRAEPFV